MEYPYWTPMEEKCTSKCPDEEPNADQDGVCRTCPKEAQYWSPREGKCVTTCDESFDANKIC